MVGACAWLVVSCHDADRSNPLDASLTPGVVLEEVQLDSLNAAAVLTWSPYSGDQPFSAYQIKRRFSGTTATEIIRTITDVADTTFRDSSLDVDRAYSYSVSVINAAGLEVAGNTREILLEFRAPALRLHDMNGQTAAASLTWTRAVSGFESYELLRQAEGETGTRIVLTTSDIDDTVHVDLGLIGNTRYTYSVTTRSTTGRELTSAPVSGKFYGLLRSWQWERPPSDEITNLLGATIDPDDRIFAAIGGIFDVTSSDPALVVPDVIYQFSADGARVAEFPPDPAYDWPQWQTDGLVSDELGVYVLLKSVTSIVDDLRQGYVNALSPTGERRFRWPESGGIRGLGAVGIGPAGTLWAAQQDEDDAGGNRTLFYILDASNGAVVEQFALGGVLLPSIFPSFLDLTDDVGIIKAQPQQDPYFLAAFDVRSRELLDVNFRDLLSSDIVVSATLGADGRLYVLHNDPWRIEVLRDWAPVTHLLLTSPEKPSIPYPAAITFDSSGNLSLVTDEIEVWTYQTD